MFSKNAPTCTIDDIEDAECCETCEHFHEYPEDKDAVEDGDCTLLETAVSITEWCPCYSRDPEVDK